jgi:hypothetical protein
MEEGTTQRNNKNLEPPALEKDREEKEIEDTEEVAIRVEIEEEMEQQPAEALEEDNETAIRKSSRLKMPRTTYDAETGRTVILETEPVLELSLNKVGVLGNNLTKVISDIVKSEVRKTQKKKRRRNKNKNKQASTSSEDLISQNKIKSTKKEEEEKNNNIGRRISEQNNNQKNYKYKEHP